MVDSIKGTEGAAKPHESSPVNPVQHQKGNLNTTKVSKALTGEVAKSAEKTGGMWTSIQENCTQLAHDLKLLLNKYLGRYPAYAEKVQANRNLVKDCKEALSLLSQGDEGIDVRKYTTARLEELSRTLNGVITSLVAVKEALDPSLARDIDKVLKVAKKLHGQIDDALSNAKAEQPIPDDVGKTAQVEEPKQSVKDKSAYHNAETFFLFEYDEEELE